MTAPRVPKRLAAPRAPGVSFQPTGARPFVELTFDLTGVWDGELTVPAIVAGAHVKVLVHVSEEHLPRFDGPALRARLLAAGAYHVRTFSPVVRRGAFVPVAPGASGSPADRIEEFLASAPLPDARRAAVRKLALDVLAEVG